MWNEIGQILVSGALDDTKTIGKIAADIFAEFAPEQNPTSVKNKKNDGMCPYVARL